MQQNRRKTDRRTKAISPFSHYRLIGRRRTIRRNEDATIATEHIDLYPRHFMFVAVSLLLLCLTDAVNTLYLLEKGAREINPIMDLLIRFSPQIFVLCKLLLTSLGLILLMAYHNSKLRVGIKVQSVLYSALFFYLGLILYQWSLFYQIA